MALSVRSSRKFWVLTNEFLKSALLLLISLMRDLFHYKECKLFNYLMTGPKKCEVQREACSELGAPRLALSEHTFYPGREEKPRAAPVTPTHPPLIVFLYLLHQSCGAPGIKCK